MAQHRFKPGHKHAKGRPPGSKNKNTDLLAMCKELGIDVFKEMLQGAANEIDPDKRFLKFKDIAPYLYARKREVEVTVSEIPDEEFDAEVERRLNERRSPAKISER